MVYKKWIKRGNKSFGPYYYRCYRDNGKTKTEYLGSSINNLKNGAVYGIAVKEKKKDKTIFLSIFALITLLSLFNPEFLIPTNLNNYLNPGVSSFIGSIYNMLTPTGFITLNNENFEDRVLIENLSQVNESNTTINESNFTIINEISINSSSNENNLSAPENNTNLTIIEENSSNISYYNETNFTIENESNLGINESNITRDNVTLFNETNLTIDLNVTQNQTNTSNTNLTLNLSNNISIITSNSPIILGKPVKWKKYIKQDHSTNFSIKLPHLSKNITIKKIEKSEDSINSETALVEITGNSILEQNWLNKLIILGITGITGKAVEEIPKEIEVNLIDNATEYEIEYETEAPTSSEETVKRGKQVNALRATLLRESLHFYPGR